MESKILTVLLIISALELASVHGDNVCYPTSVLTSQTSADSFVARPFPKRCEDGPARVIHTVSKEFHWPPIYRGSCDKLFCKDPPCLVRRKIWRSRCVLVYQLVHGFWKRIGFRTRRFIDHLECGCKNCSDITSARTCVRTRPCPNSNDRKSFCFYQSGECDCCTPYTCPPGQFFNRRTCSCDCPRGTKMVGNRCVGDCSDISLRSCKFIYCDINPQFNCFINRQRKCDCPSCDAQKNAQQCPRTKCVEQRNNPFCIYDTYNKKCRCPQCRDQDTREKCVAFYCGNKQCKYDVYRRKCFCPRRRH